MVELGRLPRRVGVAHCTVVIVLAGNMIGFSGAVKVILMTRIALFGRPLKGRRMAIAAAHVHVRTGQAVRGGVVIKCAGFPAAHGMTAHAGGVKIAQDMIRIFVGGEFIAMTAFAFRAGAGVAGGMATNTVQFLVSTG
jgi:hypothetical protein